MSCLETVSRHGFSCLGLGSVSTLVYLDLAVSSFHVSRVLTVCRALLSAYSVETLIFHAERKPLAPFTHCLLTCKTVFSERELMFTFAICYRPSVCLSVVCLSSVTFVRPTHAIEIFGNISTALGTLAIH